MMKCAPFALALVLAACSAPQDVAQVEQQTAPASAAQDVAEANPADPITMMADTWDGSINYAASFDALDPSIQPGAIQANAAFNASDEYWGLPRTNGYEDVFYTCASCHSLRLVMQQSKSEQGWSDLVDWMVEHQGMAQPVDDERARIVNYLALHFSQ